MYATLTSTGTFETREGTPDYAALRDGVGGYIEALRLDHPDMGTLLMWLNEEGKLMGLTVNPMATVIAHAFRSIFPDDFIAGNVVFTGPPDREGETTDIPGGWLTYLRGALG